MKKIYDLSADYIGGYIGSIAIKRKMKRYWGTEFIGGVEVFRARRYMYPSHLIDDNLAKLLKLLKSYESTVNVDMPGIDNAWLFLNYNKLSQTSQDYYTKEWIADMLENSMVYDQWYTFYLNFTTRRYGDGWTSSPTLIESRFKDLSNIAIYNDVIANYATIYDTHFMQGRSNELLNMEELSKFLLFNDQVSDFTIEPIRITKVPVLKTTTDNEVGTTYSYIENTISIEYRAKRVSQIDENTTLVNKIYTTALQKDINQIMAESQADNDGMYSPPAPPPPPGLEVMFYNGQLRVDYYDSLKAKDAIKLFPTILDQGVQKKKVKWYKKLLVIIIVVVVCILFPPAAGLGAAELVAYYATVVALTLTVVAVYAAKNGEYGLSEWSAKGGQIAGTVALVAGIYVMIENMSKEMAARELAKKETARQAGTTYVQQSLGEQLIDQMFSSVKDMGYSGYAKIAGYANQIANYMYANEMKDIKSESEELSKKQRELEQKYLSEDDQVYILGLLSFQSYNQTFKPLAARDEKYYNMYEGAYDKTKFTLLKSGPFAPVGVFNPSYAEETSLAMRKRS